MYELELTQNNTDELNNFYFFFFFEVVKNDEYRTFLLCKQWPQKIRLENLKIIFIFIFIDIFITLKIFVNDARIMWCCQIDISGAELINGVNVMFRCGIFFFFFLIYKTGFWIMLNCNGVRFWTMR